VILYHFTSGRYLRGIAKYGLTVGDVPTDIKRGRGRIGVWLTSSGDTASGHGLEGSKFNKGEYRLTVDVPANSSLAKWTEWAPTNATQETIEALQLTASGYESWYIFLGVVRPELIKSCHEVSSRLEIADWENILPAEFAAQGVPPWRREAWQKKMLADVKRAIEKRSDPSV
jgi:hypothetical protein